MSSLFTTEFSSASQFKNCVELFSTYFRWKPWKPNVKFEKETDKTHLIQFQLSICYKPACLQKTFHGRVLSIRVFSLDGHYGLIVGVIHSTKNCAEVWKFLGVEWITMGPVWSCSIPLAKWVSRSFKMEDVRSLLVVLELDDNFNGDINEIVWADRSQIFTVRVQTPFSNDEKNIPN